MNEYGRATQDSYVSEIFALDNNLLIHCTYSKMTSYSEETLRKLNRDNLIRFALSLQSKTEPSSAKVLEELKHLQKNLKKVRGRRFCSRNADSLLSSRLVDTESQCWRKPQWSKRETLEIASLPKSLTNGEAETKLYQIFKVWTGMSI